MERGETHPRKTGYTTKHIPQGHHKYLLVWYTEQGQFTGLQSDGVLEHNGGGGEGYTRAASDFTLVVNTANMGAKEAMNVMAKHQLISPSEEHYHHLQIEVEELTQLPLVSMSMYLVRPPGTMIVWSRYITSNLPTVAVALTCSCCSSWDVHGWSDNPQCNRR